MSQHEFNSVEALKDKELNTFLALAGNLRKIRDNIFELDSDRDVSSLESVANRTDIGALTAVSGASNGITTLCGDLDAIYKTAQRLGLVREVFEGYGKAPELSPGVYTPEFYAKLFAETSEQEILQALANPEYEPQEVKFP